MSKQVIEYQGIPVGIAVPHSSNLLRFIAVKFHVIDLDDRVYPSVSDLQAAIRMHVNASQALAA
ncbi:hypothetical protein RvVAT039_pl04200 (plasmid) [Agrobacterium vitis]|uniref:DUF433 domain-containing protein n=1 Tax=Agrobacterium vitis TaxID=373 RepID=A0ABD6H2X2_AGRVI|nr:MULTISPECIES: hypothetical protein [Rhizobium/Agrobacterium group]MCF1448027.1 hypothetical protein [Allorhizobium ampelinum]MCF1495215.1 hypothetical protein [Allorhizobium ampelinum]MUO28598.1 hypothetical protein [Agrobacterium vitis]MUO41499.1 hypothetical protein [Agrobacterium vitis]MUP09103.1 hypothetical protein [Agrobacterium vitis]